MNVLEIFCCSGGMAEGFRRAGIRVSMAVDADPPWLAHAVATSIAAWFRVESKETAAE